MKVGVPLQFRRFVKGAVPPGPVPFIGSNDCEKLANVNKTGRI
jgi:hypothetical protein